MSLASALAALRSRQSAPIRNTGTARFNQVRARQQARANPRTPRPSRPRLDQAIPALSMPVNPRDFSTGIVSPYINPINPGAYNSPAVMPPQNATPPASGSLYDAIRGLPTPPSQAAFNNAGIGALPRAIAEFGMPPTTGVVSNPLMQPGGNFPFMPNPSAGRLSSSFTDPVGLPNQPVIGMPIIPPNIGLGGAVGFGGTAETGYMTPFGNFGLFGRQLLQNNMAQSLPSTSMPTPNMGSLNQSFAQYAAGLFGQPNQFNNMNANQGMGQSLGSMGSQGFGGQFNNMQPQMAVQQFDQQGQQPAFADSFAFRPL